MREWIEALATSSRPCGGVRCNFKPNRYRQLIVTSDRIFVATPQRMSFLLSDWHACAPCSVSAVRCVTWRRQLAQQKVGSAWGVRFKNFWHTSSAGLEPGLTTCSIIAQVSDPSSCALPGPTCVLLREVLRCCSYSPERCRQRWK